MRKYALTFRAIVQEIGRIVNSQIAKCAAFLGCALRDLMDSVAFSSVDVKSSRCLDLRISR